MRFERAAVVMALIACSGCQSGQTEVPEPSQAAAPTDALVDRVWARSDSTGLPGVMRIFLSDGTLVMDSCWETYQLAKWRTESDSVVVWQEGSVEIRGTILELAADRLLLRLDLVDGSRNEHYQASSVPYLCPDMRR